MEINNALSGKSDNGGKRTSDRLGSFIHMFINRLFKDGQRRKEMGIYYMMTKYYASELARNKFSSVKKAASATQTILMLCLFCGLSTVAGRSYAQDAIKDYVQKNTVPVQSIDPDSVIYKDLQALGDAIGDARVVMLGEQDHGDAPTFLAKTRIIKYLHEEKGFNVLAFESDFFRLNYTWDRTKKDDEGIDSVIKHSIYSLWTRCHTCKQLFKDYIPSTFRQGKPLEITGFDPQMSPKYLTPLLDSELRRLQLPVTQSPEYASEVLPSLYHWGKTLKDSTGNNKYLGYLLRIKNELCEKLSKDNFWVQMMDNLVAQDREFQMNGSDYWGSMNTRDRQMALNLEWLKKVKYKNEKIIVWAASYHISKYSGHYPAPVEFNNRAQTMGSVFTSERGFADQTYVLGFASYEGSAGRLYGAKPYSVTAPMKNSFENWIPKDYQFAYVDFKKFNSSNPEEKEFYMSAGTIGNLYHKNALAYWNKVFDGVFFIREMYPCKEITLIGKHTFRFQ